MNSFQINHTYGTINETQSTNPNTCPHINITNGICNKCKTKVENNEIKSLDSNLGVYTDENKNDLEELDIVTKVNSLSDSFEKNNNNDLINTQLELDLMNKNKDKVYLQSMLASITFSGQLGKAFLENKREEKEED